MHPVFETCDLNIFVLLLVGFAYGFYFQIFFSVIIEKTQVSKLQGITAHPSSFTLLYFTSTPL